MREDVKTVDNVEIDIVDYGSKEGYVWLADSDGEVVTVRIGKELGKLIAVLTDIQNRHGKA